MNQRDNLSPVRFFQRAFCLGLLVTSMLAMVGCDESSTAVAVPSATPGSETSAADRSYAYGKKLTFGAGGNAGPYEVSGWNKPEADGTWTEGEMARLAFEVPPSDSQIMFKATLSGFVKPPELPSQGVDVFINGQQVAHWEIAVKGLAQMAIPPNFVHDGKLQIDFKLPKAASPASLGVSIDQRHLGLFFYDLELVKL